MKRLLILPLVLILIMSMVLSACSSSTTTTATSSAAATTTKTSASTSAAATTTTSALDSMKPVNLRISCIESEGGSFSGPIAWWAQELEKRTNGKVKCTIYYGTALAGGGPPQYDAVKTGLADAAWLTSGFVPTSKILLRGISLPFVYPAYPSTDLLNNIYNKYLDLVYKDDMKTIYPMWLGPAQLRTSKVPVSTLQDLKGLQIRVSPGPESDLFSALGAVPVNIDVTEVYDALSKNMIDGTFAPDSNVVALKYTEVVKYHSLISPVPGFATFNMNWNTWNNLPKEVQDIIAEISITAQKMSVDNSRNAAAEALETYKGLGHTIIELSPEERAKWGVAAEPVVDKWVAEANAAGLPGSDLIKYARELAAKE